MIPRYDTKIFTEVWARVDAFLADYASVGIPTTISTENATTLYFLLYARYGNSPIANFDETQFKYKVFSIIFEHGPEWEKKLSIQQTLRGMQLSDIVNDGSWTETFDSSGNDSRNTSGSTTNTGNVSVATNNSTENIKNNALNPGTTPAVDAYSPLTYINSQEAQKNDLLGNQTTTNDLLSNVSQSGNSSFTTGGNKSHTMSGGKLKGYERLLSLLDSKFTDTFLRKFKICFKQFVMPFTSWIYVTDNNSSEGDDDGE